MTTPSNELLARDLADGIVLPLEQRYPLDLDRREAAVYDRYHESNAAMWDVDGDVAWDLLHAAGDPDERAAASLVWSWQAWVAFGDITTSEAALIRSCLAVDVAADLKFCIAARATERAAAADAGAELASRLDRFVVEPATSELAELFDTGMIRRVLHRDVDLDALLLAHFAVVGTVDLAVAEARLDAARHETVRGLLGHVVGDLRRQEAWAWDDLSMRLPSRGGGERADLVASLADVLARDLLLGARWTALIDGELAGADTIAAAEQRAADAGLGGVGRNDQLDAIRRALRDAVSRMERVGLPIGPVEAVLDAQAWWA